MSEFGEEGSPLIPERESGNCKFGAEFAKCTSGLSVKLGAHIKVRMEFR